MKKLHIALATDNIDQTVADYTQRLGSSPIVVIEGDYALWRTATLNLSIRRTTDVPPGTLRHLGWEDPTATAFTQDTDVNGVVWERFNADTQAAEIKELWPHTDYSP